MTQTIHELVAENRRLRERIERLYSEAGWMTSELRRLRTSPDFVLVRPDGPESSRAATGNLLKETAELPPASIWPTGKLPTYHLHPPPGLANYAMDRRQAKTIGIAVCGLDPEAIERVIAMVEDRQRRSGDFCPIFLTDSDRTDIFRRRAYVFEHLPELDAGEASQAYAARRIAFLEEKWGMAGIVNFGRSAYPLSSREPSEVQLDGAPDGEASGEA